MTFISQPQGIGILNHQPVAYARAVQEITGEKLVTLYGNNSHDPDGKIEQYRWIQLDPNDIHVRLDDESVANPTFNAPYLPSGKDLVFQLMVTDNKGDRNNDTVVVKIKPSHPSVYWGSSGAGEAQFRSPQGIAIDPLFNNVYVVDKGNSRIQAFDMDGHPLTPAAWGSKGKGPGQFYLPENIAFDGKNEFLYVADSGNNRIQKFTTWGRNISSWGSLCDIHNPINNCNHSNNSSFVGSGQFRYPQGLAVDFRGNIYVSDFSNDRIQKFDSNGNFLTMWGTSCNLKNDLNNECEIPNGGGDMQKGDGQFYRPKGIAVNLKTDQVYVVDKVNDRIQKFDSNGTFLSKWGTSGTGDGQFYAPEYIAIDPRDNSVYVGDENNHRIQKFDSNGTFLSKWGSKGKGEGQFQNPEGIGIDSRTGEIYAVDENNDRIQKFAP